MSDVRLSVVIPALNESAALPALLAEVRQACTACVGSSWEAIVIDDGSKDGSFALIEQLAAEDPRIRGVRLRRNFGKSAALATGIAESVGERIVTIDGDGQDDPADIPRLLGALDEGSDLVSGWKQERRDPFGRRVASRIFNWVTARLTGLPMHDMNCGFKAYRGECARSLEVFGELHRYLPVLADQQGWLVSELPVNHRARQHGRSRFGSERYLRGALDLLTVVFIGRYQHRPLHLFGGIGIALTSIGLVICAYLTALKIGGAAIGSRPLLFLGALLIVVGIQLLTFGLLAQLVVLARRDRNGLGPEQHGIERRIGFPPASEDSDSGRSATKTS